MPKVFGTYVARIRAFHWNARLYLVYTIIFGAAMGIRRLLFNFYVLSLGYDEALLGTLITTMNLTALIAAIPLGYLGDRLGRKTSLISSTVLSALSVVIMVVYPSMIMFIVTNVVFGLGMGLSSVTMGPFLMENSGEKERTYLFSFSSGLQMGAAFAGNWLGGYLPSWMGNVFSVQAVDSMAYAGALGVTAVILVLGVLPLTLIRNSSLEPKDRSAFASLSYFKDHAGDLSKLTLPILITSMGAGLIMPFMNVFFRHVHSQSDQAIGTIFAWGSLAMGVGLLIAPVLADRFGKIQFVVLTQGLSIPFLFMLGYAPWFALSAGSYFVRLALMNMCGPVYQTFVMEQVEPSARATVASLVSMANSFGWAFSPSLSGWIQVNFGFRPAFLGTILFYAISVFLYWYFFLHGKTRLFGQVRQKAELSA
jgi:MFS family permease